MKWRRSVLTKAGLAFACALVMMGDKCAVTGTRNFPIDTQTATFAGGCFWCVESAFLDVPGVVRVVSGYTGGKDASPTYEDYAAKGHVEAVKITFDPAKTSYEKLLDIFWRQIDPTDPGGQFADRGPHYRTVIFYHDEKQKSLAEISLKRLDASGVFSKPAITQILKAGPFYPAESHHQQYCRLHPAPYQAYRKGSGRESFLSRVWSSEKARLFLHAGEASSPPGAQGGLKTKLTPLQFEVTQQCGTEPPFKNEYWNNHRQGIYVDVVSGEPLFSSTDKFDSGTGWPSFTRPIREEEILRSVDDAHGMRRTEIKSRLSKSHLGHVFDDGPGPAGQRYCVNSASLRFIPREELAKEGYAKYERLFKARRT